MFDNIADLIDKIRLGEDSYLELKEVRFAGQKVSAPHRDSLADELAAFANSRGGVCVLGVDDTREVLGIPLERLDLVEDFVRQICLDSITPPLTPVIERLTLPGTAGEPLWLVSTSAPCAMRLSAASRSRVGSNQVLSHSTWTCAFGLAARMPSVKALMPCTTSGTGKPAT